jgi:hypothetical protein
MLFAPPAWGGVWVLLVAGMAGHRPDPRVADGDPCCAHPDTWGDVSSWTVAALGGAAGIGLLLIPAVGLGSYALRGRSPGPFALALVPVAAAAATGLLIGGALIVASW